MAVLTVQFKVGVRAAFPETLCGTTPSGQRRLAA
jgi:hypothetical protein